jgi:hypothetical protein
VSGTLVAKIQSSADCEEVRIWKMVDGTILLCQGREGHATEQIIDLVSDQVEALRHNLNASKAVSS